MTEKFEIGDRVRITKKVAEWFTTDSYDDFHNQWLASMNATIGKCGLISKFGLNQAWVIVDAKGYWYPLESLARQFKVGDRVKVARKLEGDTCWVDHMDDTLGCLGEVASIDVEGYCSVQLDRKDGRDLLWYSPASLELHVEEPQAINSNNYVGLAQTTDLKDYSDVVTRITPNIAKLLHAHLGLSSEVGEIGDALKKHIAYGKPLDTENLIEEVGDVMWYIACLVSALGADFESILTQNIDKLKKRYPEGFTEKHATMRLDKKEVEDEK